VQEQVMVIIYCAGNLLHCFLDLVFTHLVHKTSIFVWSMWYMEPVFKWSYFDYSPICILANGLCFDFCRMDSPLLAL